MQRNDRWLYWVLQISGWSVYGLLLILSALAFRAGNVPIGRVIALQITIALTCFLVSHLMRVFFKRKGWSRLKLKNLVPRVFLIVFLASLLSQVIIHLVMIVILDWQTYRPLDLSELPVYILNLMFMFLVWSVVYFGYHFFLHARNTELEKIKVQNALKEAELIALKAQINPHFMFNALNNIRAMVLEDPKKARNMISNLSDLLRYSIQFNSNEKVEVAEEMRIVEDYLKLESVQYEDRLTYRLNISPATLSVKIPPMIIQLLVENAVKHGISQLKDGGYVQVSTHLEQNDLYIEVENTGRLHKVSSSGIGIRNAIERIRLLFNTEPDFQLQERDDTILATLKLKLI